jgi:hypothetical protein
VVEFRLLIGTKLKFFHLPLQVGGSRVLGRGGKGNEKDCKRDNGNLAKHLNGMGWRGVAVLVSVSKSTLE